jgi:riboflavin biosynthesis pyrimidine reductase
MTAAALAGFAHAHRFAVHLDLDGAAPDDPLLQVYGGPLRVRLGAPRLVANFVSSVDGVTSFGEGRGEGAMAVSLHNPADRFLMALLRCAADCVLIGASTLRDDAHHQWVPSTPLPDLAEELAEHRRRLTGAKAPPPLAVVSGRGELPADHVALTSPATDVLVITTAAGASRLPRMHPRVRVAVAGESGPLTSGAIIEPLRSQLAAATILCEGGPRLFTQLLVDGWVDDLFLTVAPQLAGRSEAASRPGLVRAALSPEHAVRLGLRSLRSSGGHLFLRYAVARPDS